MVDEWRYMDAIRETIASEMRDDESVFLAGTDVGVGGGIFGVTKGLIDEFGPNRIRDAPISEAALLGMAVGAAATGLRPIVEIMFMDFIGVCYDALLNQASKLPFMTDGSIQLPLVVRTQTGAGRSSGAQHSQSLEALVAHIPGLVVVMPSTADDAAGLLRAAVRDSRPVVYVENRRMYGWKSARPLMLPDAANLGEAAVRKVGSDITIVTWGRMVSESLKAAEELEPAISSEVIDLRALVPMDVTTIVESVTKTGRLVVAHDAVEQFGPGAEITARIVERAFWHLDCPPVRVAGKNSPVPFSPPLERAWLPSADKVADAVRHLASV